MTPSRARVVSIVAGLTLLVAVLVAYAPSFGHGFVNYDDPNVIVENGSVRALTFDNVEAVFGRVRDHAYLPFFYASFWVDSALFGVEHPGGWHLLSAILHAAAALMLFAVFRFLDLRPGLALAGALLWAVHPALVESVAWASGRKDVLSGFLMLAALALWLRGVTSGRPAAVPLGVLGLFLVALFSKASVFVLPVLALAARHQLARTDRLPQSSVRASRLAVLSLLVVAVAAVGFHALVARSEGTIGASGVPLGHRLVGMLGAFARYLGNLVLPTGLSVHYHQPFDGRFGLAEANGLAALLALLALAVRFLRRGGLVGLGAVWLLAGFIPFNNIVPEFSIAMADRYLYVSATGFALMVIGAARPLARFGRGLPTGVALVALVLVLIVVARNRVGIWETSETLWRDAIAKAPEETLPYLQLGHALEARAATETPAAALRTLEEVEHLYEEGLRHGQNEVQRMQARLKLAPVLVRLGRPADALRRFVEIRAAHDGGLTLDQADLDRVRVSEGSALVALGRHDEARASFRAVGSGSESWLEAQNMIATTDLLEASLAFADPEAGVEARGRAERRYRDGVAAYERLLAEWPASRRGDPVYKKTRLDHLKALLGANLRDKPIEVSKVARAVRDEFPDDPAALYLHARVYAPVDLKGAERDLRRSLELDPHRPEAWLLLARILRQDGRNRAAEEALRSGIAALDDARALELELSQLYLSFAWHHRNTQNRALAIESAVQALELDSDNVDAYALLGDLHQERAGDPALTPDQTGDAWEEAARWYREALSRNGDHALARLGLAYYHRARGYVYLWRATERPTGATPDQIEARKDELRRLAMVEFLEALRLAPADPELETLRGLLSEHATTYLALAERALDLAQPEAARLHAQQALRFDPKSAAANGVVGRAAYAIGDADEAKRAYRLGLQLAPRDLRLTYELGLIHFREAEWRDAETVLGRFLELAGEDAALGELRGVAREIIDQCREHLPPEDGPR